MLCMMFSAALYSISLFMVTALSAAPVKAEAEGLVPSPCPNSFSVYQLVRRAQSSGADTLLDRLGQSANELVRDLTNAGIIQNDTEAEIMRSAFSLAPVLDIGIFWEVLSDILKQRRFRTAEDLRGFIASLEAAELSEED